jgi:arylsulfatase A-like enzyme
MRNPLWIALLICLWFGVFAGICERKLRHYFPALLGLDDLRYAAVADLIVFALLMVPLLFLFPLRRRISLPMAAVFLCSAMFAIDGLTLFFPAPGKALILGAGALAIAAVLTFLFARFQAGLLKFGKVTLPLFVVYLCIYLGVQPLWASRQANRQSASTKAQGSAPNVLLIIEDALRADHLSTYGYGRNTSPNLTRLAAQGVLFENAVAPSSWTLPSHASILTARYPTEHHAGEDDWRLDARYPTLGEAFQKNGYRTAAFSGNFLLFCRHVGFGRGFQHFEDGSFVERLIETNLGRRVHNRLAAMHMIDDVPGRQDAHDISKNALRWIGSDSQPFFVTINFFDAHEPFMPPRHYFQRYSSARRPLNQYAWPPDIKLPPQQLQQLIDAYDGSISYVDDQLGWFLSELDRRGILKNTIVVFTSDHGEEFQEHGYNFHGHSLYWPVIHSPLVIDGPGIGQHFQIAAPVELRSLPATLLDLAGIKDSDFPGPSLTKLWRDPKAQQQWPYAVSELAHMGESGLFPSYYGAMKSVVTPDWHYIEGGKLGDELYKCCGNESQNVAQNAVDRELVQSFHRAAEQEGPVTPERLELAAKFGGKQRIASDPPAKRRADAKQREHMNEQLRALGYVH